MASVMSLTEYRFFIQILYRSRTQMEPAMVDTTSLTKSSTDPLDRCSAVANDSDLIAIVLFSAVALLASIYFSINFPMSDQVAVLLSQAP